MATIPISAPGAGFDPSCSTIASHRRRSGPDDAVHVADASTCAPSRGRTTSSCGRGPSRRRFVAFPGSLPALPRDAAAALAVVVGRAGRPHAGLLDAVVEHRTSERADLVARDRDAPVRIAAGNARLAARSVSAGEPVVARHRLADTRLGAAIALGACVGRAARNACAHRPAARVVALAAHGVGGARLIAGLVVRAGLGALCPVERAARGTAAAAARVAPGGHAFEVVAEIAAVGRRATRRERLGLSRTRLWRPVHRRPGRRRGARRHRRRLAACDIGGVIRIRIRVRPAGCPHREHDEESNHAPPIQPTHGGSLPPSRGGSSRADVHRRAQRPTRVP